MHGITSFNQVATLFCSDYNYQHRAGHFELVMNSLLSSDGFTVKAIEPELANGKKPDFLVEASNGQQFYVETRVVTKQSEIGWLGVGDGLPKQVHPEPPIRSRIIDEKMIRYGDSGKPFIVAVNTLDFAANRITFEDILLGSFGIKARLMSNGTTIFEAVRGLEDGTNDGVLAIDDCENDFCSCEIVPLATKQTPGIVCTINLVHADHFAVHSPLLIEHSAGSFLLVGNGIGNTRLVYGSAT